MARFVRICERTPCHPRYAEYPSHLVEARQMTVNGATPMPAVFLGHGTPMNALERNRYTQAWGAIGTAIPRPRAVLVVSAHWYINATAVTAMSRPRTIHDFYGFPPALFEVQYPAPGMPELAQEVADAVHPDHVGIDTDSWGIDHGAWSVLVHAYPEADIPVVQLSINASKSADFHVELGARLAALRHSGVLLLGSGNVVHNLSAMDWHQPDAAFDWARDFNEHAIDVMTTRPAEAAGLTRHPDFSRIAPTPEHFLPLLYLAGFAAACGKSTDVLIDGYAYGSLSMTCFGAGLGPLPTMGHSPLAGSTGTTLPADETNL
jgi:4,5-DOPA dioxygenase extradiol